jgi:hypothetical protein
MPGADKVPRLGAALAYYTTFSLAPLLVIIARTLRDSRAQFCLRHDHRGKTPRALFLTSLVLVLHT